MKNSRRLGMPQINNKGQSPSKQNILQNMDNNSGNTNPSLLGFLQKKSLFSNSPAHRKGNRSRSGSRQNKFVGTRSGVYQLDDKSDYGGASNNNKFNYQEDNLRNYGNQRMTLDQSSNNMYKAPYLGQDNRVKLEPTIASFADNRPYSSIQPQQDHRLDDRNYQSNFPKAQMRTEPRNFNFPSAASPIASFAPSNFQEDRYLKTSEVRTNRGYEAGRSTVSRQADFNPQQNQIWQGLVAHTHTFESARLQSIQCLQSLGGKLSNEISNISYKIDAFNAMMSKVLSGQFRNMREKVLQMVEAVFRQSDRYIKEYMKQQEAKMAGDITKMRETLLKEQAKIQIMKGQLKRQNWRKTAGEILTTQLEKRVEDMVRSSNQLEVAHWQAQNIGGTHIQKIESELRELVRLKPI